MPMTNPDSYHFTASCPYCKEARAVSASKDQIRQGSQVEVYAIHYDHSWKLTQQASDNLRKNSSAIGEI